MDNDVTDFFVYLSKEQINHILKQLDVNTAKEFLEDLKYIAKERKSFKKLEKNNRIRLKKDNTFIEYYFEGNKVFQLSIYPFYIYEERDYTHTQCETTNEYVEKYDNCQKIFNKYASKKLIDEEDAKARKHVIEEYVMEA